MSSNLSARASSAGAAAEQADVLLTCKICNNQYVDPKAGKKKSDDDDDSDEDGTADRSPLILTCCRNTVCYDCFEKHRAAKASELRGGRKKIGCMICRSEFHCEKDSPYLHGKIAMDMNDAIALTSRKRRLEDTNTDGSCSSVGAAKHLLGLAEEKEEAARSRKNAVDEKKKESETSLERAKEAFDAAKQALETAKHNLEEAKTCDSRLGTDAEDANKELCAAAARTKRLKEAFRSLVGLESGEDDIAEPSEAIQEGRQQYSCTSTIKCHEDEITAITPFGADHLLTGSVDKSIKLWDLHPNREICVFKGHQGYITSLVDAGNNMFLSGSYSDRRIKLWSASTGDCVSDFQTAPRTKAVVMVDTDRFVSVCGGSMSGGGSIWLWSIQEKSRIRKLGTDSNVEDLAVIDSSTIVSRHFALPLDLNVVKVWDVSDGNIRLVLDCKSSVRSIARAGTDKCMTLDDNWKVKVWNVVSGACLAHCSLSTDADIIIPVDERRFLSDSSESDNICWLWDMMTDRQIHCFDMDADIYALALIGSNQFATGHDDGRVRIWSL